MPVRKVLEEDKKEKAWKRLFKLLEEVHKQNKHIPPEQAEQDAVEMVRLFREKEYAKSKKPS